VRISEQGRDWRRRPGEVRLWQRGERLGKGCGAQATPNSGRISSGDGRSGALHGSRQPAAVLSTAVAYRRRWGSIAGSRSFSGGWGTCLVCRLGQWDGGQVAPRRALLAGGNGGRRA
jgi:hypothetical protein